MTPLQQMADRLAGGRLRDEVLDHRAAGRSHDEISRRLWADHGIVVSRTTVAGWIEEWTAEVMPIRANDAPEVPT